jgi:phosphoglycerate dehydrogenase-like enzyme
LFDALLHRNIFGAGIDVWYKYPDPHDPHADPLKRSPYAHLPFAQLDNVVCTPHVAALSAHSESNRIVELAKLLAPLADDKPMQQKVDLLKGY